MHDGLEKAMSEVSGQEMWNLIAVGIMLFAALAELVINSLLSKVLNGYRDQILMGVWQGERLSAQHRWQVYYADWVPLGAILTGVAAFVGFAFWRIALMADDDGVKWLGYFGAALNAWVFVMYLVMMILDSFMLVGILRKAGRQEASE